MKIEHRYIIKNIRVFSIGIIFVLFFSNIVSACTGFTASDENKVLVGINEDNIPSRRWIEIFPPD